MKINRKQAAEQLGISVYAVDKLREEGKLIDINPTKEGEVRHNSRFDSKQVNAYLKENGKGIRTKVVFKEVKGPQVLQRLETKLDKVLEHLDRLIEMWN